MEATNKMDVSRKTIMQIRRMMSECEGMRRALNNTDTPHIPTSQALSRAVDHAASTMDSLYRALAEAESYQLSLESHERRLMEIK